MFIFIPRGLLEPVWCKNNRCKITIKATTKGRTKWKAKNRVSVALSTANPPHNHCTIIPPMYGIADKSFVITVAPQNDICPQGRTYPTKAVIITNNNKTTPVVQVISNV